MNEEVLDNLPDPLEDPDTGYGDCEAVAEMGRETLQARGIVDTLQAAMAEQKRMMQQMNQSEFPTGSEDDDDDFGEVSDPDADSYPDPNDFFGPQGDSD